MGLMPWSNWNKADKTLLFAAVLFGFTLCLYLSFPGSVFARCALFCAEAALVGGVADWFAVTALFEKPLGFPWHTALLPRRRAEFMEAAAKLVRREFFSRRELFGLAERYDWKGLLLRQLEGSEVRSGLCTAVRGMIGDAAKNIDAAEQSRELAARIRHAILSVPLQRVLDGLAAWLQNGNDKRLLDTAVSYLRALTERPETKTYLAELFARIREEKLAGAGLLMNLLAGFASAMNVINFDDLAECAQQEALRVLDEAEREDSEIGRRLRETFYDRLTALGQDAEAQEAFAALRGELLHAIPLEGMIEKGLAGVIGTLRSDLPATTESGLRMTTDELVESEVSRWLSLFRTDEAVGKTLDALIEDAVRRSALQAQIMSAAIVREVLGNMTDEKLNAVVYEKVEPDLLWIRMNGSIVGAAVGLVLFVLTTVAKGWA
ncbi:MAG: DUF445 domain-containing protein [Schwartzia sp.]|nr:DUF445 domain-containing protein [Schwartzia sp. (in: firmicutes)]